MMVTDFRKQGLRHWAMAFMVMFAMAVSGFSAQAHGSGTLGVHSFAGSMAFGNTALLAQTGQDGSGDPATETGNQPAANQGNQTPKTTGGQSLWSWVYEALGLGYIIIFLGLSFVLVTFFIMNFISSRRGVICPQDLAEDFEEKLDANQFQDAFETAKSNDSFLGTVLASGMARLEYGYEKSVEAMQEVGEDEAMKLEHRLSYLDLIARVSPMVGLFGTVHGMILAFQKIAESGGAPEPTVLAMKIATALVTTLLGLAIAIPAMVAYTVLRNGVHRLVLEVGMTAEELMVRFEQLKGHGK